MPSPIGHVLAGVAIAGSAPAAVVRRPMTRLVLLCAALAALPDIDLLYQPLHRTATHSVTAVALVIIVAAAVTGWVTRRNGWPLGLVCGAAWASHLLLDWLGTDVNTPRGIQLLWPFDDRWFISNVDLFLPTERRDPWSAATILKNARAAAQELALMGSVALAVWFARRSRTE
jgi:membrane-bound metal-dependent hydrolase YbcI (DUF457 family)